MKVDISKNKKKSDHAAAYVVCEKGKEFRYYTEYGGGYARPFKALDFLYTISRSFAAASYMNKDYGYLVAAPMLEQMRVKDWEEEPENGSLFHIYDKDTDPDPDINDIPFLIMLDIDSNSLGMWFNDRFREFGPLAGKEIMISRYSITYDEMLYAADHYKEEHPDIPYPQCMETAFRKTIMEHLRIKDPEKIREEVQESSFSEKGEEEPER